MTIPSHIGQYRILRKIGAGGMGLVFLGEHTLLRRRAAIKTLLPTVAANAEIVERFFNEARATSAISDPGVIQIFDFGYHVDGTAYIVMEFLEGEALSERIDRLGKLALGDALRIARQIAGSLSAAHAQDIIHRDLKPENIFLVHDAEAQGGERSKILDFGICKVGTSDATVTQSGAMVGTPVYMSPEQCRGAGGVDHRADIYAFGCLLFHMLTGRTPFTGDAPGEYIVAHLREEPPPPSRFIADLPLGVDALVLRCLAKDPDDRFPSMTELLAALGELSVQRTPTGPEAVAAAPQVPLGRGFRSVYNGNLAALMGTSSSGVPLTSSLRARMRFAPTPSATPASNDDFEADDREVVWAPPRRRTGVRAALAGVLVIGVVLGLVATSLVLDGNDHASAASVRLPAEGEPSPSVATLPERGDAAVHARAAARSAPAGQAPADPAAVAPAPQDPAAAVDAAEPAGAAASLAVSTTTTEPARRPHEAAREPKKSLPATRARVAAPTPTAPVTRSQAAPPVAPAAAPPRTTPSPPAPTEDLYDTR